MSSSTFENVVFTPRTRGKGSGSPFKLFHFVSVLFICLLLQVNSAFAQKPPPDEPPFCYGCVSEDIKFVGITVDPPIDAKCTDAQVVPGVKVTIKLDVTSKTRYGFYIMYSLQQELADGTIVPVANATNLRECHPVELEQGLYSLVLQFEPDLIAGATLQIVNVLTAWGNQVSELGFCGTATTINEANVTCSKLDPKCKFYPEVSFEAKITTKPSAAVLAASPICAGSAAALTISGTPGATVEYKIGAVVQTPIILNAQGNYVVNIPSNVAVPPSASVTITKVINADDPTCFDDEDKTGTITINAPATVDAGAFQTVCSSSTITLAGSYTNAPGVTWTGGAGSFSNNRSVSSTYTPTAGEIGTTVTLTLTTDDPTGPCPAVADQVTITINRATSVNGGLDKEVCAGGTTSTMTATDLGGASSVTWSAPSGSFSAPTGLSTTYTPSITSGTITITVTTNDPTGPCGAAVDYVVVTVFPATSVNGGADKEVCAGGTTSMMTATNLGGASTVTWTAPSGTFSAPTSLSTTYTPSITSGTITITVTTNDPTGPCGAAVDYVVVTVFPAAMVNGGMDAGTCAGGSVNLAVVGSIGGASGVTWSAPSGSFGTPTALSTTYTPSISSGTVTVTVTTNDPTGPCGAAVDFVVVTVSGVATANAGQNQTICSGSVVNLNGSVGGAATSGTWSRIGPGIAGTFGNASNPITTYTPSAADIMAQSVTLKLTSNDPEGPCEAVSSLITITINPAATVNAGSDAAVCAGGFVNLAVVGSLGGASSVTWSAPSGSFGTPNATSTTYTPSVSSGTITVTVTTNDPAGVCNAAVDYVLVRVDGRATVTPMTSIVICQGQQAQLAGSVGGTASTLTWSGGNGTYDPNNTTGNAKYLPSGAEQVAGSVVLTLTTNDPAGECPAAVGTVTITINRAATVSITTPPATTCAGVPVSLTATTNSAPVTWSVPGSAGTFNPNPGLTTQFTPTTTGVLTITATAADPDGAGPCGTATSTVVVTVNTCGSGFCTYTQGYFGQDVGNGRASYKVGSTCTQSRVQQTIEFALASWGTGGMQVSNMNFKNVPADVAKIREYLPGGGPSAPYTGTKDGLSAKSPKNTLLAQTITLGLNMGLNSTLGAFTLKNEWLRTGSSSDCGSNADGLSTQCFKFDISANMNVDGNPGVQINDIWILANRALRGETVPVSLSMIAGAADAVNNAFDECRVPLGWSATNPCVTSSSTEPALGGVANVGSADRSAKSLTVKAYPNPFKDRVFIKFTSPVSGKAVVEIYDMTGRRLEVMNKGTVVAGRENLVEYMVPAANRNSIIYRVTVDKFSVNGRLISPSK